MRKVASFEEHPVEHLEIEQEFSRILDIEGLDFHH